MKSKFLQWLQSSFDNSTQGSSSKKLTAFAFVLLSFYLHFFHCSIDYAVEFLIVDASVILGLLGVSSWEKLKRDGGKSEPEKVS
jgi:hypothetical protein